MMQSEFDTYLNLTYIKLGEIGAYCLEKSRFVKTRTFDKCIDDLEVSKDKTEEMATDAIDLGDIDQLKKVETLDNSLDSIIAKLELSAICPRPELN